MVNNLSAASRPWRLSDPEQKAVRAAAYQAIRYALWVGRTNDACTEARFPEATGDEILDEVAGDNIVRWGFLASKALLLARDAQFQTRFLSGLGGSRRLLGSRGRVPWT